MRRTACSAGNASSTSSAKLRGGPSPRWQERSGRIGHEQPRSPFEKAGSLLPVRRSAHFSAEREEGHLDTYVILRRSGWRTVEDFQNAVARSTAEGERMPDDIAWIRSYVLDELGGGVGIVCIYKASSPEAIRAHAERAELPIDEIVKVADTVIVRPDPLLAVA